MVPQETNVQLSAVQGYMSSFYRLINITLFLVFEYMLD